MRNLTLIADLLFPHFCVGCAQEGVVLCQTCLSNTQAPLQGFFVCAGCETPTPLGNACSKKQCKSLPLDGLFSMALYSQPTLRSLLHLYKFERVEDAGIALGEIFFRFLEQHHHAFASFVSDAVILPVPLHFFRRASRGFNQVDIFADGIGRMFEKKVRRDILYRRFQWSAQATLATPEDRKKNSLRSIFVRPKMKMSGNFVLVDDVFTSGATIMECSRILKKAGARSVRAITLLRG